MIETDWMESAACREESIELFFLPKSSSRTYGAARAICARCPVLQECRSWNDRVESQVVGRGCLHGFVGGEAPIDRSVRRSMERKVSA